jgi:hypothetical protein
VGQVHSTSFILHLSQVIIPVQGRSNSKILHSIIRPFELPLATQTCTLEINTQHVNLSMSESNSLSTYIDLNSGIVPKLPVFNDSPESLESVFGYDFISFDQTTTSMPWSHEGGLQISDIDSSLVTFQNSTFRGTILSTYSPKFLSARIFGFFTDSSSGSAKAFT